MMNTYRDVLQDIGGYLTDKVRVGVRDRSVRVGARFVRVTYVRVRVRVFLIVYRDVLQDIRGYITDKVTVILVIQP
jgi:hypothetical protein